MAWLLARRHVDVFVLDGGYRAYRWHLWELFEEGPRVVVVGGGRTRSGKTRALRALQKKLGARRGRHVSEAGAGAVTVAVCGGDDSCISNT